MRRHNSVAVAANDIPRHPEPPDLNGVSEIDNAAAECIQAVDKLTIWRHRVHVSKRKEFEGAFALLRDCAGAQFFRVNSHEIDRTGRASKNTYQNLRSFSKKTGETPGEFATDVTALLFQGQNYSV
jgi:hypothetical protein